MDSPRNGATVGTEPQDLVVRRSARVADKQAQRAATAAASNSAPPPTFTGTARTARTQRISNPRPKGRRGAAQGNYQAARQPNDVDHEDPHFPAPEPHHVPTILWAHKKLLDCTPAVVLGLKTLQNIAPHIESVLKEFHPTACINRAFIPAQLKVSTFGAQSTKRWIHADDRVDIADHMPPTQGLIYEPQLNIPFPEELFESESPTLLPETADAHQLSMQLLQVHRDATQAFYDNEDEAAWGNAIRNTFSIIHEVRDDKSIFKLKETYAPQPVHV